MKTAYEKMIIGCGVWLIILSFTGFPSSWKTWLTTITGVVIVYLGALVFKEARDKERSMRKETKTETFTETTSTQ